MKVSQMNIEDVVFPIFKKQNHQQIFDEMVSSH